MIEADCQRALCEGVRGQGAYIYKIPDIAKGIIKPFDLVMGWREKFYPIEAKLIKLQRITPLSEKDVVIKKSQFRPHQLPTLKGIFDGCQGNPQIAAFLARTRNDQVVEKRGWLIPIQFMTQDEWTGEELEKYLAENTSYLPARLEWVPAVGWTVPWLPEVKR